MRGCDSPLENADLTVLMGNMPNPVITNVI